MVDLTERLGLPVKLVKVDEGYQLQISDNIRYEKPQLRTITDIKAVMKNQNADTPKSLYWMYRDVRFPEHEQKIFSNGLRYDLTLFNPGVLCIGGQDRDGDEWNKAAGHYHPYALTGKTFPEVYEVAYGKGLFLLQQVSDIFSIPPKVSKFTVVEVQAGDLVVIPPNCAHPTIVIGDEPLITANWIARAFDSQYTPIKLMKGVAYYIVKESSGWRWECNPAYLNPPEPKVVKAKELDQWGLPSGEPCYHSFIKRPESFRFLLFP